MSEAVEPTKASVPYRKSWVKVLAVLMGCIGTAALGGLTWLKTANNSYNKAIVVSEEQSDKYQWLKYETDDAATIDTITPEVQMAFDLLKADLGTPREDIKATLAKLQLDDPHLAVTLRNPQFAPLADESGGRGLALLHARRGGAIAMLIADFETNYQGSVEDKQLLSTMLHAILSYRWGISRDRVMAAPLKEKYDAGERDPLFCIAMSLAKFSKSEDQIRMIQESIESLKSRSCCAFLKAFAASQVPVLKDQISKREFVQLQIAAKANLIEAMKENVGEPACVDMLRSWLHELLTSMNPAARGDAFVEIVALPDEEFPRWVKHCVAYSVAHEIAAHYRGTEYMSEISDDDAEKFGQYGEIMGAHLLRAWCLNPDGLGLAGDLLNASNWAGVTPLNKHHWFRIALSQAIDNEEIYDDYSNALLPRWGGSHDQMLNVASLCANYSGNQLPVALFSNLLTDFILNEKAKELPITHDLRLLVQAMKAVDYLKSVDRGDAYQHFHGSRAAQLGRTLWDYGQLVELDWVLENFPDSFIEPCLFEWCFDLQTAKKIAAQAKSGDIVGWTRLQQQLLIHSHDLTAADIEDLKILHEELCEAAENKDSEAIRICDQLLQWLSSYHVDGEVTLTVDEHASGWSVFYMTMDPCENGFTVTTDVANVRAYARPLIRFSSPHVVEADLEMITTDPDSFGVALYVGTPVIPYDDTNERGAAFWYVPSKGFCGWYSTPTILDEERLGAEIPEGDKKRLTLSVEPRAINFKVDEMAFPQGVSGEIKTHGIVGFGRYLDGRFFTDQGTSATYQITNFRVRQIGVDL